MSTSAGRDHTPSALPGWLAAALVFLSSGAVLVLEIVGLRLVGPYVGVTLQTSSAVIGVALAAIAYGAWTGGWLADRLDAAALLAPTLLLAAVATAVVLPIVRYAGVALRGGDPGNVLLLTILVLFLPAALLAGVTPLVVKLQLADLKQTGRVVGRLSGIGTLGGITATLITGFVLVAALSTSVIVLSLAGALAATAGLLWTYLNRIHRAWPGGSPRLRAVLIAVGLTGGWLAAIAPDPCDVETAYHCATVTTDSQRPAGRVLWLNSARHSYVDLNEPTHLEFAYAQWMAALVDTMAPVGAPLGVLHLGGGGFTLPKYLAATRPGSDNLVLELDAGVVELDRSQLGLRTGPQLRVTTGDARVNLAALPTDSRDLVIGDAFGHLSVPWHLTTRELAEDVQRVLRPGGAYALNLIDGPAGAFARAESATLAAVFDTVALIAPADSLAGNSGSNWVLLAADAPLPLAEVQARLAGSDRTPQLVTGPALAEFTADAQVLTDDHAPVDQLLTGWPE